ncbi:MAG: Gfo/Idh/MocA family oxidoreductase [Bacteroidia bacterium]|nr:Gfo/Idh/MocA family oxidoreductase [Bacteroidia bacterium]MCC7532683.1 Gfo/Idh/MocA family oxidoreductase [Bacteroidia bacterium]MCZ2140031.1 Gfo/Idh/MocA family oxidoreductase [Bacteroidia bacterium]
MIKIGIIGANELGKRHAAQFIQMDEFELVGFYDHSPIIASTFAKENNLTYFNDLNSLLDNVDAIDILSPVGTHFRYASQAIRKSKHVLLNGLLSEDIREAKQLSELAIEGNVNIRILHEDKFQPNLKVFKRLVKKPNYVELKRYQNKVLTLSNDSMIFGMIHSDIDLLTHIIGSNIKRVVANGASVFNSHTDFMNVRLDFENGCVANMICGNFQNGENSYIKAYQKGECISMGLHDFEITKLIRDENDEMVHQDVVSKNTKKQNIVKLEMEYFAQSILSKQKMTQETHQYYQNLRVAYQVIEKIYPSTLFDYKG